MSELHKNDPRAKYKAIEKNLAEDMDRLSDIDVLQDATDEGLNPRDIALSMRATALSLVAEAKRKRLLQTREKMQESDKSSRSGLPRPNIETIKDKLQELFSRRPELAVAFRQGTKQSDSDWQSLWDDLIEIGEIKKEDLGN